MKANEAKILIVDDHPINVELLEAILRGGGYNNIRAVMDSTEVERTLAEFPPDLVLLDWRMPRVSGREILQMLRTRAGGHYIPVFVITADITEETQMIALREGATEFVAKPIDAIDLLVRIGNLLELRRLHERFENVITATRIDAGSTST